MKPASTVSLAGNWVITLTPQTDPSSPVTYTGFLLQFGDEVTGSLILGDNCTGVGPVNGTINGQGLDLDINEFGQDLTLTGTLPSGPGQIVTGQFSTLPGVCTSNSTGTWSAIQVAPITGAFSGTLVSNELNGTIDVAGSFTQGANTGASNATLSATITTTGALPFCSYLSSGSITGVISGTSVSLFFFGPDGQQLNTVPTTGKVNQTGTSMTASYTFPSTSKTCPGDFGTMSLSFP